MFSVDFIDSPFVVITILVTYLMFVLKIGPNYMKNRAPYKLQNVMLLYNAGQVLLSCFLFNMALNIIQLYGLAPKPCLMDKEYTREVITKGMHLYLLAKISELLDTIFFVLRKKMNQVSFLHVYHHTLMVGITWIVMKYEPTYLLVFIGLVNSLVHVVMYTYYGLSSFPSLTKYLWWKKYITMMQLIQFGMIIIHFGIASARSDCSPSKVLSIAITANVLLFIYLFGSFYVEKYNRENDAKARRKSDNGFQKNLHDFNTKVMQNEDRFNGNLDNDSDIKKGTLGEKYRIRIDSEKEKPQIS